VTEVGELERRRGPSVALPFGVAVPVAPTNIEAVVSGSFKAAGWINRRALGIVRQLPGGKAIEDQVSRFENAVLHELRAVLAEPNGGYFDSAYGDRNGSHGGRSTPIHTMTDSPTPPHLRSRMANLLERSIDADREISEDYLFTTIMQQLVPDEARILAALADGTVYPVIDVAARSPLGGNQRMVLRNVSSVGRAAGVASPDNVAAYLTRLQRLGLVEFGEEDPALQVQYEMLSTDSVITEATEAIDRQRRSTPKLLRRTVTISPLGQKFWAASDPSRE